jgi:hypothetical protein
MINSDLRALREYVTAPGSQNQSDATVRLLVTHSNLKAKFLEIRLDLHVSWPVQLQGLLPRGGRPFLGSSFARAIPPLEQEREHIDVHIIQRLATSGPA